MINFIRQQIEIRKFIKFLKHENLYITYFRYALKKRNKKQLRKFLKTEPRDHFLCAFHWYYDTKEGSDYWLNIHNLWGRTP